MKLQSIFVLSLILLISCKGNEDKSDAYGNFEAEETIVSSEIAGKLINFSIELGDHINKDSLLAIADTTRLYLQISQLKAEKQLVATKKLNIRAQVEVLKEQMKNLRTNQDRIHKMFADKAATQQQLDDIDGQMRVMTKQLESLNTQFVSVNSEMEVVAAQLEVMKNELKKCFIFSPMSGVVLEKYMELGELAVAGKAIVKLGDLSELDLRVYMSGAQLSDIKPGEQVEVLIDKDEENNRSLTGTIKWISPEAEFTPKIIQTKEERVKLVYAVKVSVKNDGRLKIGMPGEVRLASPHR